jgi:signal transduction histidine kinase
MKNNEVPNLPYLDQFYSEGYFSKHHREVYLKEIQNRLRRFFDHEIDFSHIRKDIWPVIFNLIAKIFPGLLILLDANGKIIIEQGETPAYFCLDSEDLIGQHILDIFPQAVSKKYQKALNKIHKSIEPIAFEYILPSPAGEQIFEAKLLHPFEKQIMIIISNITEKKRLESMAETMETINNIGYIFAGIRHEICNPVNSIKMILSVLKDNLNHFPKKKVSSYINQALDSTERIEYLLKLLKNFSIYEKLILEDVYIKPFLESFLRLLKEDFLCRGIRIRSVIPAGVGTFQVDPRALQQVIMNIISNAADSLEGKEDALILIRVLKKGNQINIFIKDNGRGMVPDVHRRIFKPFFTTKKNGTGLGLVISRKLLLLMKGSIKTKTKQNSGTTVVIRVPAGRVEK